MNCACNGDTCICMSGQKPHTHFSGQKPHTHFGGKKFRKRHFSDTLSNKQIVEDENLKILVELPGIDKTDMKISAKSDKLVIKANIKEDFEQFYSDSSVNHSIQLTENVDPTTSSAKYSDGILIVTFKLENQKTEVPIE